MPLPPAYFPVYSLHLRLLPEPSLHANPLLQTPPVPHVEGLHPIHWLESDPQQLSSSVRGDNLPFAFKDHDTGKLIPHLPLPPSAGPFLLDTLTGSRYQILFHQPNVLLDGAAVGVFQWLIAPPWRCIELSLPLPKFMAKAGRAAAARGSRKRMADAGKKLRAEDEAKKAWANAESLAQGMKAHRELEAAEQGSSEALKEAAAAHEAEQRRLELLEFEERQRAWREAQRQALEEKREYDRLSRRGAQVELQHDTAAAAAAARTQPGEAQRHQARAAAVRQGARAWAADANEREASALRAQTKAREERAAWRKAEEQRARAQGKKKQNAVRQATGASNAGLLAPSLIAHLPFPASVEIQVSWSQIGKTWLAGLVGAAAEALKYYVGFVSEGILAPGRGKITAIALDLVKSGINETLIHGGAKYLLEGTWPLQVSKKLGPVKLSASCEPDPTTGTRKWRVSLDHKSEYVGLGAAGGSKVTLEGHGTALEKLGVKAAGHRPEHVISKAIVDYAPGVPAVN